VIVGLQQQLTKAIHTRGVCSTL